MAGNLAAVEIASAEVIIHPEPANPTRVMIPPWIAVFEAWLARLRTVEEKGSHNGPSVNLRRTSPVNPDYPPEAVRPPRFVVDVHLGTLGRYLRYWRGTHFARLQCWWRGSAP